MKKLRLSKDSNDTIDLNEPIEILRTTTLLLRSLRLLTTRAYPAGGSGNRGEIEARLAARALGIFLPYHALIKTSGMPECYRPLRHTHKYIVELLAILGRPV